MSALDEIIANLSHRIHDLSVREEALEDWTALTLGANWTNGATPLAYWRSPQGIVFIRGTVVKGAGANLTIATLPVGYRPTVSMSFPSTWDATLGLNLELVVRTSGAIDVRLGLTPTTGLAMIASMWFSVR